MNDPKVLILDEATSALDYESEQVIQENMASICAGRTVFIVAHRFSTLRIVHRIITIEGGKIVEDGSIKELLRSNGPFAHLYRLQNIAHRSVGTQRDSKKETLSRENPSVKKNPVNSNPKSLSDKG